MSARTHGIRAASLTLSFGLLLSGLSVPAFSQTGPRIIDTGRLDQRTGATLPPKAVALPGPTKSKAPADIAHRRLVLRQVRIEGAHTLSTAVLASTWQHDLGRTVTVQDIYGIADAIGAAYADAGLALYQVAVPRQSFANGIAVIRVTEGHVGDVVIQGKVKGADLSLLKAYAARIVADRPLRRATLEREILLMNRISGLKVGSRFVSFPGHPGAVRLVLSVERKRFDLLAGFNNQGVSVLSRTEMYVGAAVNSVLQEGDRTEFVFGFPSTFSRYQYYGLTHIAPIGNNGATLTVSLGDLVTRPIGDTLSGNAVVAGVALSYPIILRTRQALTATAAFDLLNSNNALLGTTISDERTRALRGALSYARQDDWNGVSAVNATISQGLDVLGARRGGIAFGGPEFTKFNLQIGREQKLPWGLVARVRAAGQYAPTHLPASEQFVYGGATYGQAFYANPLYGDDGLAAYGELARTLPWLDFGKWVSGSELFGFADWGEIWNTDTLYQAATDHAASAGIGVRTKLLGKVTVQLAAANAVLQPNSVPHAAQWSAVFTLVGTF